jgi:hypothetical protein
VKSWRQDFFTPPAAVPDQSFLNQACYRKRDAAGHGDGACCDDTFLSEQEDDMVDRLFKGTLE